MIKNKKYNKLKIFNIIIGCFIIAFLINLLMFGDMMNSFTNLLKGDISAVESLDFYGFMKIFFLLSGETGVMSVVFIQASKKIFR